MKTKLKAFEVFCNRVIGETVKANDIQDLFDNRLLKRQEKFWSTVEFVDNENRNITITRHFMDDDGMTLDEVIQDWIDWGDK